MRRLRIGLAFSDITVSKRCSELPEFDQFDDLGGIDPAVQSETGLPEGNLIFL